jgi:uncharacterized protein (DUF849 family)
VVIEAALNGLTTRGHNRHAPVTPEELAADAIACIDAGATVVHTHAHNLGAPALELTEAYATAYRAVLEARPDAILYPTTGVGHSVAERYEHVSLLAAERLIRATFVDPGSVNLGGAGSDGLPPPIDFVYSHSFADIRYAFDLAAQHRLGPSVALFEPGFLQVVLAYHEAGALPPGTIVKLYFAAGGYLTPGRPLWGVPAIPEGLALYLAMLGTTGIPWAIALIGGAVLEDPLTAVALARGGHLRVGLEDQPDGPANVTLVRRAVEACERAGRPVATQAEAAGILGLPS